MNERYKHLLNFLANVVTLFWEGFCFGFVWYMQYLPQMSKENALYRRGNWAAIGLYVLIIFFFIYYMIYKFKKIYFFVFINF